jgi:hypothetical protein
MAMVTIFAEAVEGSVPAVSASPPAGTSSPANSVPVTFWRLGSGGEAEGLQNRQCQHATLRYVTNLQDNNFIPGGFDYMCFMFEHYPMTPRDHR